jgi:type II secretion system protein G
MIQKKGFTLVELLIVIALLGFLSVFGLSLFQGSQRRARDSRRKGDLKEITKVLEMYANDASVYPSASVTGEIIGCAGTIALPVACTWGGSWINGVTYMQRLPKDPYGTSYCYEVDSNSKKWYKLYARLESTDDVDFDDSLVCGGVSGQYTYVLISPNITPTPTP